jgi:hypothetical protein
VVFAAAPPCRQQDLAPDPANAIDMTAGFKPGGGTGFQDELREADFKKTHERKRAKRHGFGKHSKSVGNSSPCFDLRQGVPPQASLFYS